MITLLMRSLLLIAALCITGCGPEGGSVGDENDPTVDGTDEEMERMMEEEGELVDDV